MASDSQVREITSKLEQGVRDVFESDKYAEYLKTMSRFHNYSTRNTMLIFLQRPGSKYVAGFRAWQDKFGRHVKKGEKAIKILAPVIITQNVENERIDPGRTASRRVLEREHGSSSRESADQPATNNPILDENGMPLYDQKKEQQLVSFKVVSVFADDQTEGKPLPSLVQDITGNVEQYELFVDALKEISPLPIVFEALPDDTDGVCRFGNNIAIREGMSQIQTVCAIIHEITHSLLHNHSLIVGNDAKPKDLQKIELSCESIAYTTAQFFGIETSENSFAYLAAWSKNRELLELNASLDTIRKTSSELIDSIDEKYRALAKERGIELDSGEVQAAHVDDNALVKIPLQEQTNPQEQAVTQEPHPIFAEYVRSKNDLPVGANVLMTPVFDDGNFNRSGKRIRVVIEEPAGKYQLFSRKENENKAHYFLTASGRIERTSRYFSDNWNEQQHKWVNHRPSEAEFDKIILKIAEQFELNMANPSKWANYQDAAVLNRLDECDAHNIPVRKLREQEDKQRHEEQARRNEQMKIEKQRTFDARVDEIADAIQKGKEISVAYNEYDYGSKNPVLELFKLYDIKLPLRTQGWVNTGLAGITANGFSYLSNKNKRASTVIGGYLLKLREAVRAMPIEQKRAELNSFKSDPVAGADKFIKDIGGISNLFGKPTPPPKERSDTIERKVYQKFTELFPQFANGEYSYMRLESGALEPLSLEWIGDNQISVMHTYTMNGDLMYDPGRTASRRVLEREHGSSSRESADQPMITFKIDNESKTMTAMEYEQSMPPMYQRVDENGNGSSIDGNGRERFIKGLRANISEFTAQWLENIQAQEYMPVRANIKIVGTETSITFDKDGNPIMPEPVDTVAAIPNDNELAERIERRLLESYERSGASVADGVPGAYISPDQELDIMRLNQWHGGGVGRELFMENERKQSQFVETKENPDPSAKTTAEEPPAHVQEKEDSIETNEILPDPSIGYSEMNLYGYIEAEMLPLTQSRALELFDQEHTIYMLNTDNTEAMAFDRDEIEKFEGVFGIERAEWKSSRELAAIIAEALNAEGSLEADLLYGNDNKFGIYQVRNDTSERRSFQFTPMKELKSRGLSVQRDNYKLVYTGSMTIRDTMTNLNRIFKDFNVNPPEDYKGRSVSVSDVVVLQWRGHISSHFVDSAEFVKLPNFLSEETIREQKDSKDIQNAPANNKNSTKVSQTVSKSKPSIMAQLQANKKKIARSKQPDTQKLNERDV